MMSKGPVHPFCVDVRPSRTTPGRFAWRIAAKGRQTLTSPLSYPSFEEARRDAKRKLDEVVAAWGAGAGRSV